jgi:DNA polymerase III alpha subunit
MDISALDNMTVDDYGFAFVSEDDIVELLLEHKKVKILPSNISTWQQFDKNCRINGIENPFVLSENNVDWNLPDKYKDIDIERYLLEKCSEEHQYHRVVTELELFKEKDLYNLLKFLVYFMDVVKENNIVYGVGRGSSVASYCLYLIGVHRVDSLKYNLDIKEFLK